MFNIGGLSFEKATSIVEESLKPKKGKLVVNSLQTGYTTLANALQVLESYRDNCKYTAPSKYEVVVELLDRYKKEAYINGQSRNP